MEFEKNHSAIAWGNWLGQFDNSPRLESMVRGMMRGAGNYSDTLEALYRDRFIDTAVGQQLDGIGSIIEQPRMILAGHVVFFGFSHQPRIGGFGHARFRREGERHIGQHVELQDAEYRKLLRWKIAFNKGQGTAPDIANAMRSIYGDTAIKVLDAGNANVRVWMDVTLPDENPLMSEPSKWIAAAAGVGVTLIGLRQDIPLTTEANDDLLTEDGLYLFAEVYEEP